MKAINKQLNKLITLVKQDKQILAVILFGSCAREESYQGSDIDICLIMDKNSFTSEILFKKRMHYLKLFDMDIQIFQQLPLYIRVRIIKEGKILFCRDEDKLYELAFRTITEFADFEHIYKDYLKEVASA